MEQITRREVVAATHVLQSGAIYFLIFPARRPNSLHERNKFPALLAREFDWKCLDSRRILLLFRAQGGSNQTISLHNSLFAGIDDAAPE
jgi:hypothetical protein